ncbi:hypothetical protein WN943_005934 [Citrus x changshan-huyou]
MREKELYLAARLLYEILGKYLSPGRKELISVWLELKYAAETNSLVPLHQYVPWVIVDGQPQYEEYENLIGYICKAYKSCLRVAATYPLSPTSMGSNRSLSF